MRLATLRDGTRDGALIVVSPNGRRYTPAGHIAPNLQAALDRWDDVAPALHALSDALARNEAPSLALEAEALHSPLPRAYEWVDGSAYLNHVRLVRKARGAEPPPTLESDPLVYQGGSGALLGPREDIPLADEAWGLDFEAEVAVILGDTPQGVRAGEAARFVRLITLVNDCTLRNLIPNELAKGFGFFQSKPASAFGPFAVTPDELGDAWRDGRLHLRMRVTLNDTLVGDPEAGPEMHFSFHDLIAHLTRTRAYTAGTILGSGTVSNEDRARGITCLAERRMIETIDHGAPRTPFLKVGDEVAIEVLDGDGRAVFGQIRQRVVAL